MEVVASWAVGAFAISFVVGQQLLGAMSFRGHSSRLKRRSTIPGEWLVRIPGSALLGFWIAFIPFHHAFPWVPGWVRLIGMPVMAVGLVVALAAQHQLGRNWVNGVGIHKQHRLIDAGLYGVVRHPMYSGLTLGFIGVTIIGASWVTTMGSACMVLALLVRVPREDALLQGRFRKSYPAYRERVPALVPRLWRRS